MPPIGLVTVKPAFVFPKSHHLDTLDTLSGLTFNFFELFTSADSVHGGMLWNINHVNQQIALVQNLAFAGSTGNTLHANFRIILHPNGPGGGSMKLRPKEKYTTHATIFDIRHMPQGCGHFLPAC
ncbi:glycoside hydrolase family 16 protein [Macrolepiota fuliginosa MF-IS2]|uniref:Glycoside hydrolase family 16 protein n=1 Tax=Macrolepiota fuliginosa MF-IS2 TaxID=1400762 RepID=A0A9P6BUL2_9AGAR|nr:glycoside hydrolase family 16 protein [Macrolepiota fuliginosa MF-IS2]